MNLEGFWQENKRFVLVVGGGALVFLAGWIAIGSMLGDDLAAQRRAAESAQRKLSSEPMYSADDHRQLEAENEALKTALDTLTSSVTWKARPLYALDAKRGAPSNQYFAAVAATREDLLRRAGRANLRLPEDLGLPALSPTREGDILRYLEGLDLVDRAVRIALESGCERVDRIQIQLDPRLNSKQGVGTLERTRVTLNLSGRPDPLVAFLARSQESAPLADGSGAAGPLLVERCEMQPTRSKTSEAGLEVVFLVARIVPPAAPQQ
ncbi:MAG: hypothetical protein NTY35_09855 [Planctomycetota bacterium]|nr:hypothetical protein [Planctomycetota bacterium]